MNRSFYRGHGHGHWFSHRRGHFMVRNILQSTQMNKWAANSSILAAFDVLTFASTLGRSLVSSSFEFWRQGIIKCCATFHIWSYQHNLPLPVTLPHLLPGFPTVTSGSHHENSSSEALPHAIRFTLAYHWYTSLCIANSFAAPKALFSPSVYFTTGGIALHNSRGWKWNCGAITFSAAKV